jgi:hypothetical protein
MKYTPGYKETRFLKKTGFLGVFHKLENRCIFQDNLYFKFTSVSISGAEFMKIFLENFS